MSTLKPTPKGENSQALIRARQRDNEYMTGYVAGGIGIIMVIAASLSMIWIEAGHNAKDRVMIFALSAQLFEFTILFHCLAWIFQRWLPTALVRSIDYVYLSFGAAAFVMSIVRQQDAQSEYVALWSSPSVYIWLSAAIALRITRTTIEVFRWHRAA
jgi:type IV secretory pathway VirB2 component (pilin)